MNSGSAGGLPRRLLFASVFFCFAATINTQTFGLLLVRVAHDTGFSVAAMGGLRTLENVATIVVALLVAPLVDRFPRRIPLSIGFACAVLADVLIASNPSSWIAVAGYLLLNGTAVMLAISSALAIPGEFLSGSALNRAMGFMIAGFALSDILFLPVAGRVADRFGWRFSFLFSGALLCVALLAALLLAPRQRRGGRWAQTTEPASGYRQFLQNRLLLVMLASALTRFAQYGGMTTFLSAVLVARFGLSISTIGLIFALVGVTSFAGSASSGFMLHERAVRRALVEGGIAVAVLTTLALVLHPGVVLTITLVVMVMFGLGLQENASTVTVLALSPERPAAAMSLNELSAAAGALTGIGFGSIGYDVGGVRGMGVVLTCLALLGAASARRALSHLDAPPIARP